MDMDKNGLTVYCCYHGINNIKGEVHQNIIHKYDLFNTLPCHAINMILEYTIWYNITVGMHNQTGHEYIGHFNIPLKNALHTSLTFKLDFFKPLGMFEYNDQYAHDQKIHHQWVVGQQGTLIAMLLVHIHKEHNLFHLFIHSSSLFLDIITCQPNWTLFAAVWVTHANGKTIYYKVFNLTMAITSEADLVIIPQLPEHLKMYYKIWNNYCNESNTIAFNTDVANRICALLCSQLSDLNPTTLMVLPMTL
ncbi:hypothetical protein HD554DRAFT_2039692 [Boletus coccyginus]|nr:hypothetical protein HD554DRAFT_2039692 [Boletus coccyginus]